MRVLLVEDDAGMAQSVELMLRSEGMTVVAVGSGEEALDQVRIYDFDIVLLDLGLPDVGGLEVLRLMRLHKVRTPVVVLSGMAATEDKVRALGVGADDYLSKPFHKDELAARINAVVRRSRGHAEPLVRIGELVLDTDGRSVTVAGSPVHLTGKEYQIVEMLALRKGRTVTKEQILDHLYGGLDEPEMKIIDVYLCKVRKKLAQAGGHDCIQTVWGRGYLMREPEAAPAARPRASAAA